MSSKQQLIFDKNSISDRKKATSNQILEWYCLFFFTPLLPWAFARRWAYFRWRFRRRRRTHSRPCDHGADTLTGCSYSLHRSLLRALQQPLHSYGWKLGMDRGYIHYGQRNGYPAYERRKGWINKHKQYRRNSAVLLMFIFCSNRTLRQLGSSFRLQVCRTRSAHRRGNEFRISYP